MFTISFAISQYAAGIAVIHLLWAFFYLCGTLLWAPRISTPPPMRERGSSGALLELAVSTAAGMAIVGFISFALGMLGLLYPATALAFFLVLVGAFCAFGDSPFRRSFWTLRWNAISTAFTPGALALYVCTLVLAIPALLPETGYDALFFHLVYALDWAHAHRIIVDPWVRFPYYTQNWILLDTWMFELGLGSYIDFLGWLGGALAVIATYGLVDALGERLKQSRQAVQLAAFLSALAVLLAPVFLRWVDSGMVDAAIAFFFVASTASTLMAIATRERRWVLYTIACFAFFVGMKISFIAFLPVAIIAVWIASRITGLSLRASYLACIVALMLCAPWYVKNLIQDGDPVAPYLNLALHRTDSKWTPADMALLMPDIRVDTKPLYLLALPIDIVLHPMAEGYRDEGVSLIMLLVFLPGIALAYGLRRRGAALSSIWFVFSAFLFYAIVYWLVTTHLGRYALVFYPALAAFVGLCALKLAHGSIIRRAAVFALLACSALPAPAGTAWLKAWWNADFVNVERSDPDTQTFLLANITDYREEEYLSDTLTRARLADPRVYVFGDFTLAYYFKLHGISQVGDWFGPGRYNDLFDAVDRGDVPAFFKSLHVSAMLMSPHIVFFLPKQIRHLESQLKRAGYREERLPGKDSSAMFIAPWVPK